MLPRQLPGTATGARPSHWQGLIQVLIDDLSEYTAMPCDKKIVLMAHVVVINDDIIESAVSPDRRSLGRLTQ